MHDATKKLERFAPRSRPNVNLDRLVYRHTTGWSNSTPQTMRSHDKVVRASTRFGQTPGTYDCMNLKHRCDHNHFTDLEGLHDVPARARDRWRAARVRLGIKAANVVDGVA